SLHGQVANEIGARILRGDFGPSGVLPNEADLSAELNVSRTALREAIKVLAAKGLLESRPKTGTRVRPRESWNMLDPDVLAWQFAAGDVERFARDLFEVREIIEPPAAAMAALRATPPDVEAISAAYDGMAAAGHDLDRSIEPDLRFHLSILAASGNELLVPMGALIETALASSMKISGSYPGAQFHSLPRHKAVLDAIRHGAPEAASAAMRVLLSEAIDNIRRVIGGPPAAEP